MMHETEPDHSTEIARSQQQWQTTMDAITDYLFVFNRKREIKRANKAFSARFGKHPRELIGMTSDKLFGVSLPHADCVFERAFSSHKTVVDEAVIENDTFMISIYPVVFDDDEAYVCIMKDITEMKVLRDRLNNSYRLASIGQLVSGVAHEINNPLTGIIGFTELLSLRVKDESVLRELNKISVAAERCKSIVQSLLCFSRQQRPSKSLEYINDLIDKTIDLRTYWLKSKALDIVRDYHEIPSAYIDAQQIQHALLNILMNAEQAVQTTERRGRIQITTRYDKASKDILITISDNGPGIPEKVRTRIFDPFFTTKPVGEGSGLGLSMSYGIVTEHRGTISVESKEGEGAAFTVRLPVGRPDPDGGY